jgi:hypothetical protein
MTSRTKGLVHVVNPRNPRGSITTVMIEETNSLVPDERARSVVRPVTMTVEYDDHETGRSREDTFTDEDSFCISSGLDIFQ